MKVGKDIEGSPQEIKDFFNSHDSKISDFLQMPEPPLKIRWIILPSLITCIILLLLTFKIGNQSVLIVLTVVVSTWLVCAVHLKYKNWVIVSILTVGLTISLLLATNAADLKEIPDIIRSISKK